MIHIDEMGFSFDGSKNGVGGGPATHASNPDVADSGTAEQKSSAKVSILFGSTCAGEPLPVLIVFPSKAKNPKCEIQMLQNLHQIKGKFGYDEERHFNCLVGTWSSFYARFLILFASFSTCSLLFTC